MAPGGPARRGAGPGLGGGGGGGGGAGGRGGRRGGGGGRAGGGGGCAGGGAGARASRGGVGRQRRRDASTCRETSLSIGGGSAPTLRSETGCGNDAIHARRMRRFTAVSDDAAREALGRFAGRDRMSRRERR